MAIGLPACPLAAGGGYVPPAVVEQAVDYLRGFGPQPGSYQRVGTYPTLRGLMTWSINWDATANCSVPDEFAQAYQDLFGISTTVAETPDTDFLLWPNPLAAGVLHLGGLQGDERLLLLDALGRTVHTERATGERTTLTVDLPAGTYLLRVERDEVLLASRRVAVAR